jgi:hypothetical protein
MTKINRVSYEVKMDKVNHEKLNKELIAAGIKISGCNELGIVWDVDGHTEIQDRKDVKAIIKAHDPTPEPVETMDEKIERIVKEKMEKIK